MKGGDTSQKMQANGFYKQKIKNKNLGGLR